MQLCDPSIRILGMCRVICHISAKNDVVTPGKNCQERRIEGGARATSGHQTVTALPEVLLSVLGVWLKA